MALEIERRFLVTSDAWQPLASEPQALRQAYLTTIHETFTIRVRILDNKSAWLTIKSYAGRSRNYEFEYGIPMEDAQHLWQLCPHRIYKTRYALRLTGGHWVIDCFKDENYPLVLAEVELPKEKVEINIPSWCGRELTGDVRWSNVALAITPLSKRPR
ncbi:hypothetical protein OMCYN_00885 [cyanobiont of Ornithocercus magnificus]|nr:hypothetical protein OMCYN_00885 [cyanobiont of Ornithocercus magnificus]